MDSQEASEQLSNTGYHFNINLPDWRSNNSNSAEELAKEKERRQDNQIKIGLAVLGFIVVAILLVRKKKSK